MAKAHFIARAIKRPGALHRALGVPEGEKIPASKIEAETHSKNKRLRREALFAQQLARMRRR